MIAQLYRDGKRVLECLQRALRVADACMDTAVSVELFVEILNRYLYYYDQQNEQVGAPRSIAHSRLTRWPGYREVLERPDRAHSLEPSDQRRKLDAGKPSAALSAYLGGHRVAGVRGRRHAAPIEERDRVGGLWALKAFFCCTLSACSRSSLELARLSITHKVQCVFITNIAYMLNERPINTMDGQKCLSIMLLM